VVLGNEDLPGVVGARGALTDAPSPASVLVGVPKAVDSTGARSRFGGTHSLLQASLVHAHDHVGMQSASVVQGTACRATHVLHVIDEHVLASQRLTGTGPGTGTGGRRAPHEMLVAIAYEGTLASDGGAHS
jgi:hypothetical protein